MLSVDDGDSVNPRTAHMWFYEARNGWRQTHRWDSANEVIVLDKVARIEIFWKRNTSANATNAIFEARYDAGGDDTHAEPVTLRARRDDLQFYCGSENNKTAGDVSHISFEMFFGGATIAWLPFVDSTVIIGEFKVEIPV